MIGSAMDPFRRPPPNAAAAAAQGAQVEPPEPKPGAGSHFIGDDGDELDRVHSPGLGRLDG